MKAHDQWEEKSIRWLQQFRRAEAAKDLLLDPKENRTAEKEAEKKARAQLVKGYTARIERDLAGVRKEKRRLEAMSLEGEDLPRTIGMLRSRLEARRVRRESRFELTQLEETERFLVERLKEERRSAEAAILFDGLKAEVKLHADTVRVRRGRKILAEMTWNKWVRKVSGHEEHPRQLILLDEEDENVWLYKGRLYVGPSEVEGDVVKTLIEDVQRQRKSRIDAAKMRADGQVRPRIAPDVITFVWQRDNGKCVRCGSQQNLEIDHVVPFSKGGSSTARNLQVLCESCNRDKSDVI